MRTKLLHTLDGKVLGRDDFWIVNWLQVVEYPEVELAKQHLITGYRPLKNLGRLIGSFPPNFLNFSNCSAENQCFI